MRYFGDEALPPFSSSEIGGIYVIYSIMTSAQYIRSIVFVDFTNNDMAKYSKRKSKFVFYL